MTPPEEIREFVFAVNQKRYKNAEELFGRIKARIMLLKAQYRNDEAFKEIDRLVEEIETSLRFRMGDLPDLIQEFLNAADRIGMVVA